MRSRLVLLRIPTTYTPAPPWGLLAPLLLPFGVLLDTIGGPPGPVCDPPAALWFPFETLLDLIAPPLGSFWASFPPLWDPPDSLCPLGTLLAPFGSPLVPLMRRFPHPAPVDTVESAPFSALQTHVCQKQNICQPTIFDIIPGFVSTANLHVPPPGGSTAMFLCKVAYLEENVYVTLGSLWDHFGISSN